MTWDLGDLVPLRTTVKVDGVLTAATLTLTVTDPAGTVTTPAVTSPSTGVYTANVPANLAGDWLYVWAATGAATAVQPGQFTVEPLGLRLVSLDDAKDHLNITGTGDDEELRRTIDSITGVVEHEVGPVVPRQYTATVSVSGDVAVLPHAPVIELTAISAAQTAYTAPLLADLTTDELDAGLVRTASGANFPSGRMRVTYTAGRQPIPDAIRTAALIILQNVWETQRGGSSGPRVGGADSLDIPFGAAFTVPNRAREFLAPYQRGPAVA